MTGIDSWLPRWDVGERHEIRVAAPPARALEAALAVPVAPDRFVRALFRLRGLSGDGSIGEALAANGFTRLERTPTTWVVGIVTRGFRLVPTDGPESWRATRPPRSLQIAADFRAESCAAGTRLVTETRVAASDRLSLLGFRAYWLVVGPFSKMIRRRWLRAAAAACAGEGLASIPGSAPRDAGAESTIAETERLRIRKMTLDDAEFVVRLTNDPVVAAGIGDRGVRTVEDARRFLREGHWIRQRKPGHGQFVVELRATAEPIGICGLLFRPDLDVTDLGYALLAGHHGRGYAVEAGAAVLDYGRSKLGLERIHGLVAPGNARSIRVLEKLGLRFVRRVRRAGEDGESALYG